MSVILFRQLFVVGVASAILILPAQFEVVSIKRNKSNAPESYIRPSTGRLSIRNMSVKNLLRTAYGFRDSQISGAPAWVDSENYDIEATADGKATPRQMTQPMLQSLLEERFKLRAHQVTKELPVYVLTVANRGPNLQPSAQQICVPFDPENPLLPTAPGRNPNEICGSIGLGLTSLNGQQVTIAALAMAFSHLLGRTVIDNTNLAGEFDAKLRFAPTGSVPNGAVVDPVLADILTAVREQLGLKLESGNGPVEILVIDHVERPSEN
jgi:uncharacterized protein (TIGR03435 family)